MLAHEIPEVHWAYKLAPQLVGKAQQAYSAMSPVDAEDYQKVKEAILYRYDINAQSYWESKREQSRTGDQAGGPHKQMAAGLHQPGGGDTIVKEQLLNSLPGHVRVWVRERKPMTAWKPDS